MAGRGSNRRKISPDPRSRSHSPFLPVLSPTRPPTDANRLFLSFPSRTPAFATRHTHTQPPPAPQRTKPRSTKPRNASGRRRRSRLVCVLYFRFPSLSVFDAWVGRGDVYRARARARTWNVTYRWGIGGLWIGVGAIIYICMILFVSSFCASVNINAVEHEHR